jgi:hypothetical protein
MADILHARDTGAGESRGDVAGKIEQRVVRPQRGLEEAPLVASSAVKRATSSGPTS